MKVLILAAGLGSRLENKTINAPKAMVKIKGKPIISHQIEALKFNKLYEIGVVLGYKSDVLKKYLLDTHKDINFSFFFNEEYEFTNSAYSFYLAKEYVKDISYIHLNCDILFSNDLLSELINSKYNNAIAISKKLDLKDNMEQVELDSHNKIIKMDNLRFDEAKFKAYGLAKFSHESTIYISKKIELDLKQCNRNKNYYGIIRQAIFDIDYYGIESKKHGLLEINTLEDFDLVSRNF